MPRHKRATLPLRLAVAAAILAALSFGGTLLYLALQPPPAATAAQQQAVTAAPSSARLVAPIDLTTIEVPNEAERLTQWSWMRFRAPRERWTAEDVDRFWIDPGRVGAEYLSQTNRRLIEELLSGVP
ncbi:MAG: hypothetical protein EA384_07085 [Spirochaetaceae bacterium]|nr:MAG: hypothetical protein EA384_07085 [Spirochaetaceae bacterium]